MTRATHSEVIPNNKIIIVREMSRIIIILSISLWKNHFIEKKIKTTMSTCMHSNSPTTLLSPKEKITHKLKELSKLS